MFPHRYLVILFAIVFSQICAVAQVTLSPAEPFRLFRGLEPRFADALIARAGIVSLRNIDVVHTLRRPPAANAT